MFAHPKVNKSVVLDQIGQIPQIRHCGIIYVGENATTIWKKCVMPEGFRTWLIIQDCNPFLAKPTSSLSDSALPVSQSRGINSANQALVAQPEKSIWEEGGMMMLNCGSVALSITAGNLAVGAAPLTAGASGVLAGLAYASALAGAAQCGLSIGRVTNKILFPGNNAMLDANDYYKGADFFMSATQVANGVSSFKTIATGASRVKTYTNATLQDTVLTWGANLSKLQRKRLVTKVLKETRHRGHYRQMLHHGIDHLFTEKAVSRALKSQVTEVVASAVDTISGSNSIYGASTEKDGIIRQFAVYFVEN